MSAEFQSKFGHIAEEFERYRPDYPPELFHHILAAVPADHRKRARERAIDLGAGTGKSTRMLLPHFREVIAVEPDPGMAAKLKQEIPSIIVHTTTAEDFSQPASSVDLVTIGNALHLDGCSARFRERSLLATLRRNFRCLRPPASENYPRR